MKCGKSMLVALILVSAVGCLAMGPSRGHQVPSRSASANNENVILQNLRPVLNSGGRGARIYYGADCQMRDEPPLPFPRIEVQMVSHRRTALLTVQAMFRRDKEVTVTEGRTGIIRIKIGQFPSAILRTKITSLTLTPLEQYNPTLTLSVLENTKDVNTAMRRLGVHPVQILGAQLLVRPNESLPHLSATLDNITLDQALDLIAETFNGVVVYGACAHIFKLDFVDVVKNGKPTE